MSDLAARIERIAAAEGGATTAIEVAIVAGVGGIVRIRLPIGITDHHDGPSGMAVTATSKPPDVGWRLDPGDAAREALEPVVLDAA